MATGNRKLTEPLESTTLFFGLLFAAALVLGALATLVGTGTALLTFARIVRLGAAMDDQLQGTV
jgi:demethoxyubiquinone hydroxylase (CLK1/Coq7/Cat5 family)